jgi:hypothetical protein
MVILIFLFRHMNKYKCNAHNAHIINIMVHNTFINQDNSIINTFIIILI